MNIREWIEKPVYELLAFHTEKCAGEGEATEYLGVKLLREKEKFVKGALFCSRADSE